VAKKKKAAVVAPEAVKMKAAGRQIALLLLPEDERLLDEAVTLLSQKNGVRANRTDTMRWLIRNSAHTIATVKQ